MRNLVYLCEGQPEAAAFVAASNDADRKSIRSALLTTEVRGFARRAYEAIMVPEVEVEAEA